MLRLIYLSALSLCFSIPVFGSVFDVQMGNNAVVTILLQLSPDAESWQRVAANSYSSDAYQLTLEESSVAGRSELNVRLTRSDGQIFTLENFQASWPVHDPEFFAVWTYNQDPGLHKNYHALSSEPFGVVTSANFGIPYAAAVARNGKNLLAVGILSQDKVIYLSGNPQENNEYQISLGTQLPLRLKSFTESLFTDASSENWFEVARGYALWVDEKHQYTQFPISSACFYPMYDTWYWSLDNVNLDLYWKTLLQAKGLGFQSYLFDAGWESRTGELNRWLEGSLGNYFAPEDKLPKFADFLQKVKQSLQMNVVLWMAPYAMGRQSLHYPTMKNAHSRFNYSKPGYKGGIDAAPYTLPLNSRFEENVNLCPRTVDTQNYMKSLLDRVSDSYHPDGYWLDFQEGIPFLCQSSHKHSSSFEGGFNTCQGEIRESVLQKLNQPTVELRYPVANLNNKRYANLWQSIDFPEDFDAMRLCNLMMRPFSQGVVMATDQMYWSPAANDITAAKFAATTVFSGVPAFGANFLKAPRSHSEIVRAWLSFYKENQADLTRGTFKPTGDFVFPDQKIESENKAFIYLRYANRSEVAIDGSPRVIYIVNCTGRNDIGVVLRGAVEGNYQLQVLDLYLRPVLTRMMALGNAAEVNELVPQGSMLKLTRQN